MAKPPWRRRRTPIASSYSSKGFRGWFLPSIILLSAFPNERRAKTPLGSLLTAAAPPPAVTTLIASSAPLNRPERRGGRPKCTAVVQVLKITPKLEGQQEINAHLLISGKELRGEDQKTTKKHPRSSEKEIFPPFLKIGRKRERFLVPSNAPPPLSVLERLCPVDRRSLIVTTSNSTFSFPLLAPLLLIADHRPGRERWTLPKGLSKINFQNCHRHFLCKTKIIITLSEIR